jgi:nitroreductase/NAD-dependent dihydropyrimidine dehydrogenase PreA subunit
MSQITVDRDLCLRDGLCVDVCSSKALRLGEDGFPEEVAGRSCNLCGHCTAVCVCEALAHTGLPSEPSVPAARELPAPALIDGFLLSRRSVREFKNRPVARETLEALLDVARHAPTGSNTQKLHWIVVNGAEKVRALSAETMDWARQAAPQAVEFWQTGYDLILRGAPAVVVACAPADYIWAAQDCAIALTFLELAAEARGLGACWTGYLTRAAAAHAPLRRALSLPEGYVVSGGLMLGEPKYKYQRVPPRKPLSAQWI